MLAFRVEIDSHPPLVAGMDDWSVLALHVNAFRGKAPDRKGDLHFSVGGLTTQNAEGISHHFRWPLVPLSIGSKMNIVVVETESPDEVAKRFRADKEVQENPFTEAELKEMRRQQYLALKAEFEGERGV